MDIGDFINKSDQKTVKNFFNKVLEVVIKLGINEVIYRSSFLVSIPENKLKEINIQFRDHMQLYENYNKNQSTLEELKQEKLTNDFLIIENKKLRNLINESVNSE